MNVIDATCPLVHEIHREVKKLAVDGRQIIVIGDHGHDEVIAITDQVENPIIIANPTEASKLKKYKAFFFKQRDQAPLLASFVSNSPDSWDWATTPSKQSENLRNLTISQ